MYQGRGNEIVKIVGCYGCGWINQYKKKKSLIVKSEWKKDFLSSIDIV